MIIPLLSKFVNNLSIRKEIFIMKFWKSRRARIALIATVISLALIVGACAIYVGDYYHADMSAIFACAPEDVAGVSVAELEDGTLVFAPETAREGFIFYPGGKVDHRSYMPLMMELAEQGILCVLVKMPFHLAVLDVNAADGIPEQYPNIERWYIGGHSLGGSMAASYLSKHTDDFEGLILLASYSTADLSDTSLRVVSIYGSEDRVMNAEKYEKYKKNLPADLRELVIEGGCHAYFGMYGAQKGDGEPVLTNEEQIALTAQYIMGSIFEATLDGE